MPSPYDIDFIDKRKDIKYHIKKFLLYPDNWDNPSNQLPIPLNWKSEKFLDTNLSAIPLSKGVYAFTVNPDYEGLFETKYLFYIGKTNRNLRTRFSEYLNESKGLGKSRIKVYDMLTLYADKLHFNYATIPNTTHVNDIEDKLINTFVPHVNVAVGIAKIKPEYLYLYE